MNLASPQTHARRDAQAVDQLLRQGDARWADKPARRREHALVVPWPDDLLHQFSLRMAGHGMSISRTHMLGNPGYAMQQLVHGRAIGDESVRCLADQLFRFYESHQSGVTVTEH